MSKTYYEHEGKKYPRVTSICGQLDKSGPLTYWAAGCACDYILENIVNTEIIPSMPSMQQYYVNINDLSSIINDACTQFRSVSQVALDIGSQVHGAIEKWLNTGEEPKDPSPEVLAGFIAFLEWHDERDIKTLHAEHTVYYPTWAGTCDWVCEFEGKIWVIDFKTSKKPKQKNGYEEWLYQLSAYRICIERCTAMGVLRLDKETGMPDWYPYTDEDYERGKEIFHTLASLWYLRHPKFGLDI